MRRAFGVALAAGLALVLLPDAAHAQVVVTVNDTLNFRLGFLLQTKITAACEQIVPNVVGATTWKQKNTNHFVQFQFLYF